MLKKRTHQNVTWIDLTSPTKEEVQALMEEYKIHPLVANELLSPTLRSRADVYDNFTYLIFHFPTVVHSHDGQTEQEVDFVIGKDFIITAHYEVVDSLNEFAKQFEVDSILEKNNIGTHAGFLFFYILRNFYSRIADELHSLSDDLKKIEGNIFSGKEHEMVEKISHTSRKLLDFKRSVRPHREILDSFELSGKRLFGEDFTYYLRANSGEYYRISATLDSNIETLSELRSTNDSLLNTKTNDTMRVLTIMAFVTFPLSLFASIFGMNTKYLPIVGVENDFWIIIGGMIVAMFIFFSYFKSKKWL